jgi:HTH-type transcriptional regulator/antitoxin MqsA
VAIEPITDERIRCPVCGKGYLERRLITDRFEYDGGKQSRKGKRQVTVVAENVPVRVCTHCQETFSGPEAGLVRNRAICRALGLLTPEEICSIRERLKRSQADFAKLTGIGEATISRWERGRLLQSTAMDRYLRLLATNPENITTLQELLPDTEGGEEEEDAEIEQDPNLGRRDTDDPGPAASNLPGPGINRIRKHFPHLRDVEKESSRAQAFQIAPGVN